MSFIEVKNLTKIYNQTILANNNLTFSIERGEIIGLLGKNGAGKTTLISLLSQETSSTSGSIWIDGLPIEKVATNSICTVQQEFGLFDFRTVKEHLQYFSILRSSKNKSVTKSVVQDVIDQLKLEKILKRKTITLSGGEKRRLLIAIALLADSDILILDEPTANLDIEWKNYIIDLLFYLNKVKKKTIIYSSHNIDEVEKITDKVLIMNQGEIIYYDKISTILSNMPYNQKIVFKEISMVNSIQTKANQDKKNIFVVANQSEGVVFFNNNDVEWMYFSLAMEKIVFSQLPIMLEDVFKFKI